MKEGHLSLGLIGIDRGNVFHLLEQMFMVRIVQMHGRHLSIGHME